MRDTVRTNRFRWTALLAGPTTLILASALFATPASATPVLIPVPPGCGSFSGTMVDATLVFDFRASPMGVVFTVPANIPGQIVIGSDFGDQLTGGSLNEILCGRGGPDIINGGGDDDVIFGGDGRDELSGQQASDTINGGDGNDDIWGDHLAPTFGDFNDTLQGGSGSDRLWGGPFTDTLQGGSGGSDVDFGDGGPDLDFCNGLEVAPVSC